MSHFKIMKNRRLPAWDGDPKLPHGFASLQLQKPRKLPLPKFHFYVPPTPETLADDIKHFQRHRQCQTSQ
jgi:hypothetical protein